MYGWRLCEENGRVQPPKKKKSSCLLDVEYYVWNTCGLNILYGI